MSSEKTTLGWVARCASCPWWKRSDDFSELASEALVHVAACTGSSPELAAWSIGVCVAAVRLSGENSKP